jgi:hypothetical protein
MRRLTLNLVLLLLPLSVVCGDPLVLSAPEPKTYGNTRKMLLALDDLKSDSDKLAALFKIGDMRIRDLIRALDDTDSDVSLRAQVVIRYLGNGEGMRELVKWYDKHPNGYPIAGPIPLPLSAWDYEFIGANLIGKPPEAWREIGVRYIYALAIDDTQQSKSTLDKMIKNAGVVEEGTFVGRAIKQVRTGSSTEVLTGRKDVAKLVLENAFFISPKDHNHATARLLAVDGTKDKALVEVYINRGRLAEEWYHVVMKKCGQGWRFLSITQVAVS